MNQSQRLLRVGNVLLNGPETLYPAGENSHLYLATTVSTLWRSETASEWKSLRVYCDANGSDDEGYLEPMVRFALWHREKDVLVLKPPWPDVSVELAKLPAVSPDLQGAISQIQEAVARAPFPTRGLPVRRIFAEYPGNTTGYLRVAVDSGWQKLERSLRVAEAPALHEAASVLEKTLRRLALPVERGAWLERYDRTPEEIVNGEAWYWDGRPVS